MQGRKSRQKTDDTNHMMETWRVIRVGFFFFKKEKLVVKKKTAENKNYGKAKNKEDKKQKLSDRE